MFSESTESRYVVHAQDTDLGFIQSADISHPLGGALVKIVRAEMHLKSLKDEIGKYLATRPYRFPRPERVANTVMAKPAIVTVPPPLEISCIVGECIAPLRHALDYIAWECAKRYSSIAPVIGKDKGIYFPIMSAPSGDVADRFTRMAKKYRFPDAIINLFESVQPYHAGYESLGILNSLSNQDKHCLPILTIGIARTDQMTMTISEPGRTRTCFASGCTLMSMAVPDAPIRRSSLQHVVTTELNGQVTTFVSLENSPIPRKPVEDTIQSILKVVADIVSMFRSEF